MEMSIRGMKIAELVKELESMGINVSESKVYQMARAREIPHVRIGVNIFFLEDQIEEWIRNGGTINEVKEVHRFEAIY